MSASLLAVGVAVILWACQKEKYPDEELSAAIASSSEMEQYIISGYELQIALNEWEKAMDAIDWSKLSYVIDNDGREVAHLPVSSLVLETKLDQFNNCKSALQRKYPQVKAMSIEKCYDIVRTCVQQSETISTKLLDMGVNIYQPITKNPDEMDIFREKQVIDSLTRWTNNSNYVEAATLMFADSTSIILIDPRNGPRNCIYPSLFEADNGKTYYPPSGYSNSVIRIGHTHQFSANPSGADKEVHYQGVERTIFFNGAFHKY